MRQTWALSLVLASSATLLASLYLPLQQAPCGTSTVGFSQAKQTPSAGLQNLFTCSPDRINGWSLLGEVAAIAALLLAFLAIGALSRPNLRDRLPIGLSALVAGYLAFAVVVKARADALRYTDAALRQAGTAPHFHVAYGTYVEVAAGIAGLLGAVFLRRRQLSSLPSWLGLATILGALTLLVVLLLYWMRSGLPAATGQSVLGIEIPPGVIAALLALGLIVACWSKRPGSYLTRVGLAAGTMVFTGAAFTANFAEVRSYGAWAGLGIGIALVLAALVSQERQVVPRLEPMQALSVAASGVFVASLFLPWQTARYGTTADFKALGVSGRSVSTNGFYDQLGTLSAVIACGFAVAVVVPRLRRAVALELAFALALLTASLGFRLGDGTDQGTRLGFGYGSYIGFAVSGLLLLVTLATAGPRKLRLEELVWRLPGIVLSLAYVVAVVVPWSGEVPSSVWSVFSPRFWGPTWLTTAGALVAIRLVGNWLQTSQERSNETLILPLALAALAILNTVPFPHVELTWDSGLLLGLSLTLLALGLVESRGGIRNLRVPKILRLDRI